MSITKRPIKFLYYKVFSFSTKDGSKKYNGDFDLMKWLNIADDSRHHNIRLSDTRVYFGELYSYLKENIYVFRIYKLRDTNIPSKVKEGKSAETIPLDEDEYIGEDMFVLYDWETSVCMIQSNRMSVGIKRLAEWINKTCNLKNEFVEFVPISDKFTANKLNGKLVRSIDFSFANTEVENPDGPLGSIIKNIGIYKGINARLTISVGRTRHTQLDHQNAIKLIEDIHANSDIVTSARTKLKSISDDDKGRTEIVDIFETSLYDYLEFEFESRKPLDFDQARVRMYDTYSERKEDILRLCQKENGWKIN